MTKKERIAQLEQQVALLQMQVMALQAAQGIHYYPKLVPYPYPDPFWPTYPLVTNTVQTNTALMSCEQG